MKITPCRPKKLPLRFLDWKQFVDVLGKAHRILAQYEGVIKSVEHPKRLFALLSIQEALASLEAEPNASSVEDVLSKEKFSLQTAVFSYQKALAFVQHYPQERPISCAFLCRLHRIIKKGAAESGKIRKRQNWIGPEGKGMSYAYFLPPSVSHIPNSLGNLKKYVSYPEKDVLVQLAIFFAQLLIIHPFMDGNGRLARVLVPFFLYKKKLLSSPLFYLSLYFKKHRLEYFERLFAITKENDWEGWIRFFLKGIIEEGRSLIDTALKIRSHFQQLLKEIKLSDKERKYLEYLFSSPIMKKERWEILKRLCKKLEILEEKGWVFTHKKYMMLSFLHKIMH